jgi:hypothetical protein
VSKVCLDSFVKYRTTYAYYIVNRSVIVGTCHSDMYYLTLTSFQWSFVINRGFFTRPISPLLYHLGSPYVINILIMVGTSHPDMYHLTLTSCLWSSVVFHEGFLIKLISPLLYHLGSPYVINILIIIGTC